MKRTFGAENKWFSGWFEGILWNSTGHGSKHLWWHLLLWKWTCDDEWIPSCHWCYATLRTVACLQALFKLSGGTYNSWFSLENDSSGLSNKNRSLTLGPCSLNIMRHQHRFIVLDQEIKRFTESFGSTVHHLCPPFLRFLFPGWVLESLAATNGKICLFFLNIDGVKQQKQQESIFGL